MSKPTELDPRAILSYVENRFPREYEIAVQAVYIAALEQNLGEAETESVED